jgi:hypothetical protein
LSAADLIVDRLSELTPATIETAMRDNGRER